MLNTTFAHSLFLMAGIAHLGTAIPPATAPAEPPRQAYDPSAPAPPPPPQKIYVDQRCRVLPDPTVQVVGKAKPRKDHVVCHLEGVTTSVHVEETDAGNSKSKRFVTVQEQEYVVQNVTTEPVTFVVAHVVPKDWAVDSDPKPAQMVDSTAVFFVNAGPGQIVRLHVGMRHIVNAKKTAAPSTLPPSTPPAPASSAP